MSANLGPGGDPPNPPPESNAKGSLLGGCLKALLIVFIGVLVLGALVLGSCFLGR
jgi:hypothetical protein